MTPALRARKRENARNAALFCRKLVDPIAEHSTGLPVEVLALAVCVGKLADSLAELADVSESQEEERPWPR